MRTVTLEEHFVTKEFLKATGAVGDNVPPAFRSVQASLLDIGEERLASMHRNGISMQVLSLAAIGFDDLDASTAVSLATNINDEIAEHVRAHPENFAAFATLPMKDPAAAAKELERAVRQLGCKGAMLDGTVDGDFLDHPRFLPVWEAAAALDVPIYLHPAPPPEPVRKAYYSGLPAKNGDALGYMLSIAGWGWHAETGLHTLRLILSGLFERFPLLQLILGHMGEGLPYALERSSAALARASSGQQRSVAEIFRQQVHVTTSGYFTRPPFDCAEEVLGIDRLLFSVDYPFSPNEKGRAFLDALNPMDNDRRAKLMHRNAEKLLKL